MSSLPVYAGTWPTYQSDFCLGGVAQLLRWCVAESGRGEGSRAVEATTVLWTEPFVPSGHSSSVKCSVSYHGTNSAPSSRPRDRHVLCSHIDALYLISNTAALNLCAAGCDSLVLRVDPVSALPVYADIRPRIASRSSAWVMCHSCSVVAWWSRLGDGEAEVVVVVTGHYPSVYLSFCSLAS